MRKWAQDKTGIHDMSILGQLQILLTLNICPVADLSSILDYGNEPVLPTGGTRTML